MRSKVTPGLPRACLAVFLAPLALLPSSNICAQASAVRNHESANHGFLVLRNQAGATIGSGELIQMPKGDRMTARLIFRFKDGSIDDETTVYSQDRTFRLISDRHVQRGPFFPHPIDTSIDMASQQVRIVSLDKDSEKSAQPVQPEHMDLPADLSNGLVLTLIKNLQNGGKQAKVPYLAFSPKGRVVNLAITSVGRQSFRIGGHAFPTDRYAIKIELGGIAGVVAPIIGKQPSDIEVWVAIGRVPAIVRVDGALYLGGPTVSIQLGSPTW